MKWVLILMFMGPAGTTTERIEFESRDLCTGAGRHLVEVHNAVPETVRSATATSACVQVARNMPNDD